MSKKPQRRQIRNYLLDRKFQLSFTLIIVFTSGLLTAGLGYFWYSEMRETSESARIRALTVMGEDGVKEIETQLASQDRRRLMVLAGFGILLALVLAVYGIIVTHRVAGPLYKIGRHMEDLKQGKLHTLWDLRKGDQLREFWQHFKEMHDAIRERAEYDVEVLNNAIAALEEAGDSNPAKDQLGALREVRDRKKAALSGA